MNFISKITPKGWIAIVIVLLIIILIIYFSTRKKTVTTTTSTTTVVPNNTNTTISSGNGFPLQMGSIGDNVKKWQTYLNSKGATLVVDGIWGVKTEAASLKYAGFNSVTQDYFNGLGI